MGWSEKFRFRDCPWCGVSQAHLQTFLGQQNVSVSVADGGQRYWNVLACPRCGGLVCIETNAPNEEPPTELSVVPDAATEMTVGHLPPDVERYYLSAIRVLDIGEAEAAAVQLRRTLEAAAAHRGIAKGPLMARIRALMDEGLITREFSKVLHHVRQVGNQGAHHTDEPVDEESARRALRFTTQVLRNLYEMPAELQALGHGPEPPPEEDSDPAP